MFTATIDEDGVTVRVSHGDGEDAKYVGVLAFPGDPDAATALVALINGA